MDRIDAIALFSGGLDSILAARLLADQGLNVLCLHMTSPFFGDARQIPYWQNAYGLRIAQHDLGDAFVELLRQPAHGFGKTLNPCVDCKILLLQEAKKIMLAHGAKILATGEVIGQRPMSQRRDVLNTIMREADVKDCLLRPLSAQHLDVTPMEAAGLVDREKLLAIQGRGRQEQLALAQNRFHLAKIPSPSGGCKLTERENARRYWMVLEHSNDPKAKDFDLANTGRQFWLNVGETFYWLSMGRNSRDNDALRALRSEEDALITFPGIPSPVALARYGSQWPDEILKLAGQTTLSYAIKALANSSRASMNVSCQSSSRSFVVEANRQSGFSLPDWETIHTTLKARRRRQLAPENEYRNTSSE
ncbi:MAG: tRNA(5-methylaminomethyl-2-thiouridylate) methyltransferase [Desulfovibrio sp.]|nr:tRNA(5-methylaminomethyl-2-thiouridylate) methyltransferase [Desulfovibrio sp.]